MTISVPAANINATVYARSVGSNGVMGNPAGAWDVIWYDFAQNFPGLGGRPGEAGSNAVFAGHVDYIRVGPAVFWSVRNLKTGDQITVRTANGTFTYSVQWTQWAGPYDDFTGFVAKQGQETVTLVTCIGEFSGGHYSNRFIVRAVRI
jgi:LPXTG-site transpeptidase (sortase) family protein